MFDEIFIKEMSPIDAYNYGRQTMEKELNEIHLCECNKIRADVIDECINAIDDEYYDGGYGDYHEVLMIVKMLKGLKEQT